MAKRGKSNLKVQDQRTLYVLESALSRKSIERLAEEVFRRMGERGAESFAAPADEIAALCTALCAPHPYSANRQIADLRRAGVSVERIYHEYLAVAARELGARWDRDKVRFQDVGIATARIYGIISALREEAPEYVISKGRSLAFAAVPGEQHTLGVEMAVDGFRRAGWDVTHLVDMSHEDLLGAMQEPDLALLGLSASGRGSRAALVRLLVALRLDRPDLAILLSGDIVNTDPTLAQQFGIDGVVRDIPEALRVVERLIGTRPDEHRDRPGPADQP